MADMVIFPRKLLIKFILLYKELPCLWNRKCSTYKHKQKRHEAVSKLTELLQQHYPKATRVHVLRKIESLRACVRREYKRVIDSREKASSPDEVYTPHLWYYDLCSFVFGENGNNYQGRRGSSDQNAESEEEIADDIDDHEEMSFAQPMENYPVDYNVPSSMVEVTDNSMKRYPMYDDDVKTKRHCTEINDEYDAIGINVAAKLRSLPPNMRILAEKLVNDVLFQAQVNGLTSATVISTPDPFKQDV
ncbi:uncharacterized protein [Epargyreus clarus]|uniref:uncharacterized protein n=1 Tax=Epargyreus clarus TaxID=520877 RepID=UPI003C2E43A0